MSSILGTPSNGYVGILKYLLFSAASMNIDRVSVRISGMRRYYLYYLYVNYCLGLCCGYHNVSAIELSDLHQEYVDQRNLQGISN